MAGLVKLLRGWEWPLLYACVALTLVAPFGFPGPTLPPCPGGSQTGCFAHCVSFARADVTAGKAPSHFDQVFDNLHSLDTLPGARLRCPAERFDVVGERVGFALVLLPLAGWVMLNHGFARGTAIVALLLTSTGVFLELFGPPEELQTYVFEVQMLNSIPNPTYSQSSSWSGVTIWPTEVRAGLGSVALLLMIGLSPLRLAWRFVGPRLKPGGTKGLARH